MKLITAPTVEPVTRDEAKAHCRVDDTIEHSLIDALIVAARQYCEQYTGRAFIQQTWEIALDDFADDIVLPMPPLLGQVSVTYLDTNGQEQTLAGSNYVVDDYKVPARITRAQGYDWPQVLRQRNAVKIRFQAGYGATAASVPQAIRQAILLLIGQWFDQREPVIYSANRPEEVPFTVRALLDMYRMIEV